ncbi:MAG: RNA polymerase sigma factor [Parabacteroides merdae]
MFTFSFLCRHNSRNGTSKRFEITVLPLREQLINTSWRRMEDRSDAEDIVQETFLGLWQISREAGWL